MANESKRMTPEEMLEEVDQAIYTILVGGQSYKMGSRQLTRADLKELNSTRDNLIAQTAAGTGKLLDNCFVAIFDGR